MKKTFLTIFTLLLNLNLKVFADNAWIFRGCLTALDLREWNEVDIDTIPCVINNAIDYFMGIAWTISVIFVIIGAYQMLFWSLAKDNSKWKTTIIYAISWFVLAAFSWAIIKFIFDNFSS